MVFVSIFSLSATESKGQSADEILGGELDTADDVAGQKELQSDKPVVQSDLVPENPPAPKAPPKNPAPPKPPPQPEIQSGPPESDVSTDENGIEKNDNSGNELSESENENLDENPPEPPPGPPVAEQGKVQAPSEKKPSGPPEHLTAEPDLGEVCHCKPKTGIPYRDRRSVVSGFFGVEGGTYSPTNYVPQNVSGQTFGSLYGTGSPNIEIVFGAKYNFILGSLGLQVSAGYFSATATLGSSGSTLSVIPVTAGVIYSMDSLFKEPYVVPYAVLGAYTDFFKETTQGLTYSGQTSYAPFYSVGAMFQLDWIDPETHDSGYKDFGLENTFIFLEMRSFLASNDAKSDFSTPLQLSGGLRFEF